jgi:UDP-3-O-[3-hydroxymyristoyl] glucosamine N-acyltransferase
MEPMTVAAIAERLNAALEGPGDASVQGVADIRDAEPDEISFVGNPKYALLAGDSRAAALIVSVDQPIKSRASLIRVPDPNEAFARVTNWLVPPLPELAPGVHPSAVVDVTARLGDGVRIGPNAVVEAGAVIGSNSHLHAGVYVGPDAHVGEDCRMSPGVVIRARVRIGDRVHIHDNSVVGSDGFGYAVDNSGVRVKIEQRGTVVIENDVEIGALVAIDRARFGATRIGVGVKIDNLVQVAHNVTVGDHTVLVSQVGISGSCRIGEHAILAGQVGMAGHLNIGDRAVCMAKAGISKDVAEDEVVFGYPAMPVRQMTRILGAQKALPALRKRVAELERMLKDLQQQLDPHAH